MTPEEIGADIYRKYHQSPFADKNWCRRSLAYEKDKLGRRVDAGFFKEEARLSMTEPRAKMKVDKP